MKLTRIASIALILTLSFSCVSAKSKMKIQSLGRQVDLSYYFLQVPRPMLDQLGINQMQFTEPDPKIEIRLPNLLLAITENRVRMLSSVQFCVLNRDPADFNIPLSPSAAKKAPGTPPEFDLLRIHSMATIAGPNDISLESKYEFGYSNPDPNAPMGSQSASSKIMLRSGVPTILNGSFASDGARFTIVTAKILPDPNTANAK